MQTLGSASEQILRERITQGGFAVALSGGGHRATLVTLGALLAIVDRSLAPKIIQVSSVSGGSITNAFVAHRAQLERLGPGELDNIATELATKIIRKGVLTWVWISLILVVPVMLGIVGAIGLRATIVPYTCLAVVIGVGVALTALLARGRVVDWLIDRRYFRNNISGASRRNRGRAPLKSLSGRDIDHVLCMTDLALGLPVYASSQNGGLIWRRLKQERHPELGIQFQPFDAGQLTIAELVRASAAFPGIPPRRLRIPPDPAVHLVAESPGVALLADGGIWNNLGSQVLREDGFIGSHAAWDNGILRPYGPALKEMPLLCVNGSAPLRPTHTWMFQIPGVALVKCLLQTGGILSANTVQPRIDAMSQAFVKRCQTEMRPAYYDPADLVCDLRPTKDIATNYRVGIWKKDLIRKTDPSVKEWERSAMVRLRLAHDHAAKEPQTDWLGYILGTPEPQGSFPVSGLADIDNWDSLRKSPAWKQLVESEGTDEVTARTTLGRIERRLARRLITRGYLNTYFVSLFIAPLANGEIDRLGNLSERLDKIVGG